MATALGLLGMIVFIVCVIAFAAVITWLVVKLTPARGQAKTDSGSS